MTQQTVGKVYAEGLFLLAQEEHRETQVYRELNEAADVMAQHPEFTELVDVPTLDISERIAILRRVIGDGAGITENFLCLLVEKHRFRRLQEIRADFNKLYHKAFGIAEVFVTSAVALDDSQREELKSVLGRKLGKTVELRESVDPSLLGGMVVQYGDTRMDNSLRTRMQQFKNHA
ncbi:MAG: ATP synthase F1 subunit delta [Oscillospiraceae bacterium]|nr:ATP synthase F1 subunit delta [Oscillospiraceae bacterium]